MRTKARSVTALARRLWLDQLAQAIDDAQQLAWRIGMLEGQCPQMLEIYGQLESARAEVDALRKALCGAGTRIDVALVMAGPRRAHQEPR